MAFLGDRPGPGTEGLTVNVCTVFLKVAKWRKGCRKLQYVDSTEGFDASMQA